MYKYIRCQESTDASVGATEIVRMMYNKFPEYEFIDERDMGESVGLFYRISDKVNQDDVAKELDTAGVEYRFANGTLRIIAREDVDDIEECDSITSADDLESRDVEQDATAGDSWLATLYGKVDAELKDAIESTDWDSDDENVYLKVFAKDDRIIEFTIPMDDLTFNFDKIDDDVEYIVGAVNEDIEDDITYHNLDSVSPIRMAEETTESDEFFYKPNEKPYWYFTRHGVQPGSVPNGLVIEDVLDTPQGTFFSVKDYVITTDALKWYDIKEKALDFDYDNIISSIDVANSVQAAAYDRANDIYDNHKRLMTRLETL